MSSLAWTRRFRGLALVALTTSVACGENPLAALTGLRILGTAGGSDTVLAMPAQSMVVEVRDNLGRPAAGVAVWFRALPRDPDSLAAARGMYVCQTGRPWCAAYFDHQNYTVYTGTIDTTDSDGRASAKVQYGVVAGAAIIEVSVPELGIVREVQFTTLPGALHRVIAAVEDTAVYVGSSYEIGARAADRFGNARTEGVTLTPLTPAVASVAGGRLTALSLGRGRVLMRVGAIAETAYVSVPPHGRLVTFGWAPDRSSLRVLALINTDGTGRRMVLETHGYSGTADPIWSPDGGRLIFAEATIGLGIGHLQRIDTVGTRLPFLTGFSQSLQPAASSDSIYFYGQHASGSGIHRAGVDGTGAVFLFPGTQPAPAPDGLRVAYALGDSLMVRDMTTGVATPVVAMPALAPSWSPVADLIAFIRYNGQLEVHVVHPDGTGLRMIGPGFHGDLSWSPDGAWLATSFWSGGIELIRVADGERLPISGTGDLFHPAWRPQ